MMTFLYHYIRLKKGSVLTAGQFRTNRFVGSYLKKVFWSNI